MSRALHRRGVIFLGVFIVKEVLFWGGYSSYDPPLPLSSKLKVEKKVFGTLRMSRNDLESFPRHLFQDQKFLGSLEVVFLDI